MASRTKADKKTWIGRVLSGLVALLFIFSASMKFKGGPELSQGMTHLGWLEGSRLWLGTLEISCAVLYLIPQIAVLGAILLTGFLGGAIATHLRIGEPVYLHIVIGLVIWGGVYLREPRLKTLLPVRK